MTKPVQNPTNSDWYYYSSDWGKGRTSSWTNAHCFSYYWIDINDIGKRTAYAYRKYLASDFKQNKKWYSIYSYIEPGDIIQYIGSSDCITYHSQAVHRTTFEDGEFKVSVGQHTKNEWRNLRNYVIALPENTVVCLIKIKQFATTETSHIESFKNKTVDELDVSEEYIYNSIPLTDSQENEKWSKLNAIKEELIRRAETGSEIKAYVEPISKTTLKEIINYRIENNNNIINSIKFISHKSKRNSEIIINCRNENDELKFFLNKVLQLDENDVEHTNRLWNEYWNDIVKQSPPLYYQ